jgi:hypothetical protein
MISFPAQDGVEGYGVAVFSVKKTATPYPYSTAKIFQTAAFLTLKSQAPSPR